MDSLKRIIDLRDGDKADIYALVNEITRKTASNNKDYYDVVLSDATGSIVAKLWDASSVDGLGVQRYLVVKARGSINLWNGQPQFKVEKLRVADKSEYSMSEMVKTAPLEGLDMYNSVLEYVNCMEDDEIKALMLHIIVARKDKLLYYPAAKKNHHSIQGGLLYHVLRMLELGVFIGKLYPFINMDLLKAGIVLHDIEKLEEMDANELGIVSDYTDKGKMLGHIVQGIVLLDKVGKELGIDEEKIMVLQHMVLSHHSIPEYGSPKPPMIPEAELLHHIDMIDSRMYTFEDELQKVDKGGFSERIFELDRRSIYKTRFDRV